MGVVKAGSSGGDNMGGNYRSDGMGIRGVAKYVVAKQEGLDDGITETGVSAISGDGGKDGIV
ncbi:hypothetical protein ES705_39813 [subsurface metagenome]